MGINITRTLAALTIAATATVVAAQGPVDMTSSIRANQFINEWQYSQTPGWSDRDQVAEFYKKREAEITQCFYDMPAGIYTLQCNAFARTGNRHTDDTNADESTAYIYIKPGAAFERDGSVNQDSEKAKDVYTYGKKIVSLYSEKGYTYDPYTFPDNMAQACAAFESGQYMNETQCVLAEPGILRLGLTRPSNSVNDWICFDNFKLFYQESEGSEKVDMTDRILNADFSENPVHTAWTNHPSTSLNSAFASRAVEWYRAPIDLTQTISGLEAGRYKVICQAFKRDYNEVTMFANENTTALADFWSVNVDGLSSKQSLAGAGELFDLGYYNNSVIVDLKAGEDLNIGLKKEGTSSKDWVAARGFSLIYLPAISAPANNLDMVSGNYEYDFITEGALNIVFDTEENVTVYYKWKDGEYEVVPVEGVNINEPGSFSYYAVNTDEQISQVETIDFVQMNLDKPVDVTGLIKNQTFTRWEGSTNTTWLEDGVYEKFNWGADEFSQTLYNLPAGIYTVKGQGFYRNGANLAAYKDNSELAYLFINATEVSFPSLFSCDAYGAELNEEGTDFVKGTYTYPNSFNDAKAAFAKGEYKMEASAEIAEGGSLKIGHKHLKGNSNNWVAATGFHLYYQASADAEMKDVTALMFNPDFSRFINKDFGANVWNFTVSAIDDMGFDASYNAYEFYNRTFDFSQTISGLAAGRYRVSVQGFMRSNSNDVDTYIVANEEEAPIARFAGFAEGVEAAIDLQKAALSFDQGMYDDNRVFVEIGENEDLTLGLKKPANVNKDWVAFRSFSLVYLPEIAAPETDLDIEDNVIYHNFTEGSKIINLTHSFATIFYKWEPEASNFRRANAKEGFVEHTGNGIEIKSPGTLSYYAENAEGQQSAVNAIQFSQSDLTTIASPNVNCGEEVTEYYNLQGLRIDNPTSGSVVIEKKGKQVRKVIVK